MDGGGCRAEWFDDTPEIIRISGEDVIAKAQRNGYEVRVNYVSATGETDKAANGWAVIEGMHRHGPQEGCQPSLS